MMQRSLRLIFLLVTIFVASCYREPMAETPPPTPTPLPGGSIFFEPNRISTETKAIEVQILSYTKRGIPVVEHSIVITEPTTVREITATILAAASGTCTLVPPTPQQRSCYVIGLYLYSYSEVLPLSATSGQWMLAEVGYFPEVNYISINRPGLQEERVIQYCPVSKSLREILERELALRGVHWK